MTADQTRAARLIKQAKSCYAQVRFGCSEQWVRVSKADARQLVKCSWSDETDVRLADDGSRDVFLS